MRILEFCHQTLKSFSSFLFRLRSAICNPRFLRYLSLGQQRALLLIALLIFGLLYFKFYHSSGSPFVENLPEVVVEVLGEVRNAGIHRFPKPPTLKEAIEKAGGLKASATPAQLPLSGCLETGTLVTVTLQSQNEIKIILGRMEAKKLLIFSIPLDLNRVSVEDLCWVPGIGESLAQEIVAYRERRKGFRSVGELKRVKGIGEKKWQTLKTYFRVTPS